MREEEKARADLGRCFCPPVLEGAETAGKIRAFWSESVTDRVAARAFIPHSSMVALLSAHCCFFSSKAIKGIYWIATQSANITACTV